jgi:hypothetical protein
VFTVAFTAAVSLYEPAAEVACSLPSPAAAEVAELARTVTLLWNAPEVYAAVVRSQSLRDLDG